MWFVVILSVVGISGPQNPVIPDNLDNCGFYINKQVIFINPGNKSEVQSRSDRQSYLNWVERTSLYCPTGIFY